MDTVNLYEAMKIYKASREAGLRKKYPNLPEDKFKALVTTIRRKLAEIAFQNLLNTMATIDMRSKSSDDISFDY